MKQLNVGVIGLGSRGSGLLKNVILSFEDVRVVALCDLLDFRVEEAKAAVLEKHGNEAKGFLNFKEMVASVPMDAVVISSAWEAHIPIARETLKAGIPTAMEVGGAYSVEDVFELVRLQEETGTPFMFLENCCYGKDELLATAMLRHGLFGDVVHASGMYGHDLRNEIAYGKENHHYRLRNYLARNCENYPTHELLPIAKALNINRGNRFVSLVSVASRAAGMEQYIKDNADKVDPALQGRRFMQGDIVDTIITCADGTTVRLCLDTTLPRSYDRAFTLRGTKGMYSQTVNGVFLDGDSESFEPVVNVRKVLDNAKEYEEKYLPDIWKAITPEMLEQGHGGMDVLEFEAFFDAVRNGKEMPIDIYDAACNMVVSCLTEQSIAQGGAPVAFPDFTCGAWLYREPKDVVEL